MPPTTTVVMATHLGQPLRSIHCWRGTTVTTSIKARKAGPTIPWNAWSPNMTTKPPAPPSSRIRPRGMDHGVSCTNAASVGLEAGSALGM